MGMRVGKISAKNENEFRDAVTYVQNNAEDGQQKQDNVTQDLYFSIPMGALKPPNADDQVLVAHLESGQEVGIVLGRIGSEKFAPPEWFSGLFLQAFSRAWDKCYARYTDPDNDPDGMGNDGKYLFHNEDDSRFEGKSFEFEADEKISGKAKEIEMKASESLNLDAPSVKITGDNIEIKPTAQITIDAPQGRISFSAGDIAVAMASLPFHAHNCTAPGLPSGPPIPLP